AFRFRLQQFVQRFFRASLYQFFDLPLDSLPGAATEFSIRQSASGLMVGLETKGFPTLFSVPIFWDMVFRLYGSSSVIFK
ncbi:MAG: hypothetical protein PUD50_14915, partial [Eubacteriales bacterium]|nr:hypothetical protein [Eubacteriales bacterium]